MPAVNVQEKENEKGKTASPHRSRGRPLARVQPAKRYLLYLKRISENVLKKTNACLLSAGESLLLKQGMGNTEMVGRLTKRKKI
jgi:hypothetical protein